MHAPVGFPPPPVGPLKRIEAAEVQRPDLQSNVFAGCAALSLERAPANGEFPHLRLPAQQSPRACAEDLYFGPDVLGRVERIELRDAELREPGVAASVVQRCV